MKRILIILTTLLLIMACTTAAAMGASVEISRDHGTAKVTVPSDLAGPSGLKITPLGMTAKLEWTADPSPKNDGYAIYLCKRTKSEPSELPFGWKTKKRKDGYYWCPYELVGKTKKTSVTMEVFKKGTYYIAVISYYKDPAEYISNRVICGSFKATAALTAPKIIEVKQTAAKKVLLKWSPGKNVGYYRIYRATSGGKNFELIGTTQKLSFTDKNVRAGRSYKYKIASVNADTMKFSSTVNAYLMTKTKVKAFTTERAKVRLTWGKVKKAERYDIYQKGPYESAFTLVMTAKGTQADFQVDSDSGRYQFYVVPRKGDFIGIKSNTASLTVTLPDQTFRAVVIGQTYSDFTQSALPSCENDRAAVEGMLQSLYSTRYSTIQNVKNGTKAEILNAIDAVFSQAKSNDVCLLYYSGHGGSDGSLCDRWMVHITPKELRTKLDQYKGKKLIILDSCHSGATIGKDQGSGADARGFARQFNASVIQAFRNSASKSSEDLADSRYYVITACKGDQLAYCNQEYGFFTRQLLIGLGWEEIDNYMLNMMFADQDGDAKVSLKEAYEYATEFVTAYYDQYHMEVQVYPDNCNEIFFAR